MKTSIRLLSVALLGAALAAGCSSEPAPSAAPTSAAPAAPATEPTDQAPTADVVGLLKSVDEKHLVLTMPDGKDRTFLIRAEEAPRLGIRHLASHAGLTDIGFRITYITVGGNEYVVAAEETGLPQ
ncbi:hypothetical protein [Streptosporangium longisporum]|uniref:Uncharacterized protein n=1 Tax=Streptosporangium longisporum TaxID=46187 RepID=A0ABN3Y419_9ACTN